MPDKHKWWQAARQAMRHVVQSLEVAIEQLGQAEEETLAKIVEAVPADAWEEMREEVDRADDGKYKAHDGEIREFEDPPDDQNGPSARDQAWNELMDKWEPAGTPIAPPWFTDEMVECIKKWSDLRNARKALEDLRDSLKAAYGL